MVPMRPYATPATVGPLPADDARRPDAGPSPERTLCEGRSSSISPRKRSKAQGSHPPGAGGRGGIVRKAQREAANTAVPPDMAWHGLACAGRLSRSWASGSAPLWRLVGGEWRRSC